mmetsp:Transcript_25497/g.73211  ORF Transcript_25497/g.73211 Transcript_25497/m.73211 type:complete len:207 (-) Transcript_25497:30-650(-)
MYKCWSLLNVAASFVRKGESRRFMINFSDLTALCSLLLTTKPFDTAFNAKHRLVELHQTRETLPNVPWPRCAILSKLPKSYSTASLPNSSLQKPWSPGPSPQPCRHWRAASGLRRRSSRSTRAASSRPLGLDPSEGESLLSRHAAPEEVRRCWSTRREALLGREEGGKAVLQLERMRGREQRASGCCRGSSISRVWRGPWEWPRSW